MGNILGIRKSVRTDLDKSDNDKCRSEHSPDIPFSL
jgi:hypothetical protein